MTAWLGWLSLGYSAAPGQWYAGLNFAVHALMYSYYTAAAALPKPSFARWCRPLAPFITTIQILQMAAYAVVNAAAVHYTQPPTHLDVAAAFVYQKTALTLPASVLWGRGISSSRRRCRRPARRCTGTRATRTRGAAISTPSTSTCDPVSTFPAAVMSDHSLRCRVWLCR